MALLGALFGTNCETCGQKIKGEKFPDLGPGWLCQSCYRQLEARRAEHDAERKQKNEAQLRSAGERVKPSISLLGRNDLLGPPTHWDDLRALGNQAIPHVLPLLDLSLRNDQNDLTDISPQFQNNVTIVAAVARLLGELGAKQAIPKLQVLSKSEWAEVHRNAFAALAMLDQKTSGALQLDRQQAYEQIARLWTAIIQGRQKLYPPAALAAWARQAVIAIPDLTMSNDDKARAWAMVGSLLYKSLHPDWVGSPYYLEGKCLEAKSCFQEALRISPGESLWTEFEKNL